MLVRSSPYRPQQSESTAPRKMDSKMDLKCAAVNGFHWMSLEHRTEQESSSINGFRCFLDFAGIPWIAWVERVMGIEPTLAAWEAAVLPLNYTRNILIML
jgi:hypothetical protein